MQAILQQHSQAQEVKNMAVPLSVDNSIAVWKSTHLKMIEDVKTHGKVIKDYAHGPCERACSTLTIFGCTITCCLPCLTWDMLCCTLDNCCCKSGSNPFSYGTGVKFIDTSCTQAHADKQADKLATVDRACFMRYPREVHNICVAYLAAIDEGLALKTVQGAKRANILRKMLVDVIRDTHLKIEYICLIDNGDLEKVRRIVNVEIPECGVAGPRDARPNA